VGFLNTRTNRATYWLCLAALAILYGALNAFSQKQVAVSEGVLIVLCIPRLHDIGRSGWWAGAVFALELATAAGAFLTLSLQQATIVMGVFVLLVCVLLIWLGAIPGQPETNVYGDPPGRGLSFKRNSAAKDIRS
jgi:uncharacterized membrane protein YhaH (DUF805 family)